VLLAVALVGLGPGCSSTGKHKDGDPLKGEFKLNKDNNTATQTAKSPVPPIPEYKPMMSTAAMAVDVPLQGGKPLQIADEKADVAPGGWKGQPQPVPAYAPWQAAPAGQNGEKPVLGQPQPIALPQAKNSLPSTETAVVPSGWTVPKDAATIVPGYLQQELRNRGVLWQRLETTPNGVRFVCAVPHPQNSKAEWMVEAVGADAVTAIQAALQHLDGR
jgi:hypothetical protein